MKAKKMLALLLSGAMALTVGVMAACTNNGGGGGTTPGGESGIEDPVDPPVDGYDYTLDTHEYHLVGNGAGDLKQNNWTPANHDFMFVRDETADHNVFKVTIDMYGNDAFKILCEDDDYDGPNAYKVYSMAGYQDGVVADEDGNVMFTEGEYGNIVLAAGNDGTYTFSLHTFPDEGPNATYITYTKDGELAALVDMYVVGDFNDFGDNQNQYKASHMTKNGSIWQFVLTITEKDVCRNELGEKVEGGEYAAVAVRNDVADADGEKLVTFDRTRDAYFNNVEGFEYNLLKAGIYTLRYNADEDTLTIEDGAYEMYFTGTMNGWSKDGEAEYKLTEDANGNWYGYITVEDGTEVKLYNLLTKADYTSDPGNGNIVLTAGEYFFRFTTKEKKVEYEACDYYIAGGFTDVFWGIGATSPKLAWNETGKVYTVDLKDIISLEFKVVYGSVLGGVKDNCWYGVGAGGNDNVVISAEGDYTVTYNPATNAVSVAELATPVTVSFDLNYPDGVEGPEGQVAPEAQTIYKRQKASKPATDPTLDDYTFLGWFTDKECDNLFDFTSPVTSDMTLYAGWILTSEVPENPNITFNWNDGTGKTQVVETVGGLIGENMPADPERSGYFFLGWYTSSDGNTLFNFETRITVDTNVFAKWLQIDTHEWHIVGTNISGINEWDPTDKGLTLTHDNELYPNQNVFTITVTLTSSAKFKILGVDGWSQGYEVASGNIVGGNGELGGSGDIVVNKTGIYTLILSTENNGLTVKLTYTYESLVLANEVYFYVNNVQGDLLNSDGKGTWTGSITFKAGQTVKLVDKKNNNKEYAVNITEAGDYFVKLVISTGVVTIERYGYYLAGGFAGASWGIDANSPKMTWDASAGVYTYELVASAGDAFKVVYGYVGYVKDWISNADASNLFTWAGDGNLVLSAAGTYTITYNPTTGKIDIAKK